MRYLATIKWIDSKNIQDVIITTEDYHEDDDDIFYYFKNELDIIEHKEENATDFIILDYSKEI
jgi:hypothetical protein